MPICAWANVRSPSSDHPRWGLHASAHHGASAHFPTGTLAVFRSPAFNFDPVNTFHQQAAFAQRMRPIVEEFGAVFVDLFPATLRAAFPPPSVPDAEQIAFDDH